MKWMLALSSLFAVSAFADSHLPVEVSMTLFERRDGGYVGVTIREPRAGALDSLISKFGQGEYFMEGAPGGDMTIECRRTLQTGRSLCTFGFRQSATMEIGSNASRWAVVGHLDRSQMGTIRALSDIDIDFVNHNFDEFKLKINADGVDVQVLNN